MLSLNQAFNTFVKSRPLSSSTLISYAGLLTRCELLAHRDIENITRADIETVFLPLHSRRPAQAAKLLRMLKAIFAHAGAKGNPAREVEKQHVKYKPIARWLSISKDDIPHLFQEVDKLNVIDSTWISFLLLTGLLRADTQKIRWQDLNLDNGTIRIYGSEAQEDTCKIVRLSLCLCARLRLLKARTGASNPRARIFAGVRIGVCKTLEERLNIRCTPHILSRSFLVFARDLNIPPEDVERVGTAIVELAKH